MLTNRQIAQIFLNIADLLEIKGENKFKFLSYRRVGEVLQDLPRDLQAYADDGTLESIDGVGKAIAEKIRELLSTGKLEFYERLIAEVPATLVDIMRVNGVGAKKAKLFWQSLGISTLEQLQAHAEAGKLRELDGMGEKSEKKILEGIASLKRQSGRMPIGKAKPIATAVLERLLALPQVQEGVIAGSIRRGRTTIGDVDILIASDDPAPIMQAFVETAGVARILGQGESKSSVEMQNGLQIDVRVLPKSRWGTALQYFTGSKDHNVKLRALALDKGYSLNESAFSPVDSEGVIIEGAPKMTFDNEEAVYNFLGLPYIAPELREDSGEIEAAQRGALPNLITLADVHADLHMHTTWSDGTRSVLQMAEEALQRGLEWIVITDHSRSLGVANGLSIERLMEQQAEVRHVNELMQGKIRVLHGTEMDIKADGTMDYPDDVLAQLDFVIASLHVSLNQPRAQITERLINAIRNPHVDMIGHPSARYIPEREPVDADWDTVFSEAQKSGIALEINSNPRRLDLDAPFARRAVALGIPLAINTDAHHPDMLDTLPYGIVTARRGWVEARHVLNAWTWEAFSAWLSQRG
jgi:DNA polymerase (family 10)